MWTTLVIQTTWSKISEENEQNGYSFVMVHNYVAMYAKFIIKTLSHYSYTAIKTTLLVKLTTLTVLALPY